MQQPYQRNPRPRRTDPVQPTGLPRVTDDLDVAVLRVAHTVVGLIVRTQVTDSQRVFHTQAAAASDAVRVARARSSASLMLRSNMPSGDADAMMTMESRLSLTSGLLSMVSSLASDSSFVRYFFSSRDRSKRKYRRMIALVSLRRDKSDTACCAWLSFRQQTHASINKNIFRRNSIGPVSIKFLKNSNPSLPLSFSSALFSFL